MLLGRRGFAGAALALPLVGCAAPRAQTALRPAFAAPAPLVPLRLSADRITRITTCLRPFRPAGPRIQAESLGDKRVVHNYGHGGSGWSLAWGSAAMAVDLALAGGTPAADSRLPRRRVAVIGCGAIGITTALLLQRAGAQVVIYARERPADTRSARATGTWSPDSRVADRAAVDAGFADRWEAMARRSFAEYQRFQGLAQQPVAFTDRYSLLGSNSPAAPGGIDFAHYERVRLSDIIPPFRDMAPGTHPFNADRVRHGISLQFNITELQRLLTSDFLHEGGQILPANFRSPADVGQLPEPVIVNCTGYGARALWADESLIPVRGQLAWLPAQPEAPYGLYFRGVSALSRPDGLIVQAVGNSDMFGVGEADEQPNRQEALDAIATLAGVFA